jgi:hypothetical protein
MVYNQTKRIQLKNIKHRCKYYLSIKKIEVNCITQCVPFSYLNKVVIMIVDIVM